MICDKNLSLSLILDPQIYPAQASNFYFSNCGWRT